VTGPGGKPASVTVPILVADAGPGNDRLRRTPAPVLTDSLTRPHETRETQRTAGGSIELPAMVCGTQELSGDQKDARRFTHNPETQRSQTGPSVTFGKWPSRGDVEHDSGTRLGPVASNERKTDEYEVDEVERRLAGVCRGYGRVR
jgi:hypothetical protein